MLLGVKEGKYFQGRLNVSRLTLNEATVNVQGLYQDILISNLKDQNRACNGDVVAIEILPKANWLKNYKSMEPANALLEETAEEVLENKTDSPIMH